MSKKIPFDHRELFKNTFEEGIEDLSIEIIEEYKNENGVIGNIFSVVINNNETGKKLNVIVKQQKSGDGPAFDIVNDMFKNELSFYKYIWRRLVDIYKNKTGKLLHFVPNCEGTVENGLMVVALENLSTQGFVVHDKTKCFDNDHFCLLYKTYGIFHGLSMILKQNNIEEYLRLVGALHPIYKDSFGEKGYFTRIFEGVIPLVQNFFDSLTEGPVFQKIDFYVKEGYKLVHKALLQDINNGVLVHGDCWSNNLMFKYDENGNVEKIKLLDFQQVSSGSPVLDLSYCLYAGGCGESFKNLDYYLKIYHESLSETLKEFDLDVEQIYSFKRLKDEWKKYCKFGFAMAVILWRVKFIDEGVALEVEPEFKEVIEPIKIRADKEDEYKQIIRDLVYHMYENDFF